MSGSSPAGVMKAWKDVADRLNGYQEQIVAALAASGLDSATQQKLNDALALVQATLEQARQAPGLVAQIVTTPQGAASAKMQLAQKAYQRASDEASAALDQLAKVAYTVRQQVGNALRPTLPAGVSDVMLLDRKRDVEALLEAKGKGRTPSDIAFAAAQLLKPALADAAQGDKDAQLTAFVLAGGVLDFWYEAHGVNPATYEQAIANVIGQMQLNGAPAGVAVRALLGGGPGSLAGFIDVAKTIVQREMQQANAALQRAPYTVQDNPGFPYNGPKVG